MSNGAQYKIHYQHLNSRIYKYSKGFKLFCDWDPKITQLAAKGQFLSNLIKEMRSTIFNIYNNDSQELVYQITF